MIKITRIRSPHEIANFLEVKWQETDDYYRSILKYGHSTYGAGVEIGKMEAYREILNFLTVK